MNCPYSTYLLACIRIDYDFTFIGQRLSKAFLSSLSKSKKREVIINMLKTIGACVNVALSDYDESTKNHVVELMKESLREQSIEFIFENTWEVVENKRKLYKNEDGSLERQDEESGEGTLFSEINDPREILEVMTVGLTVKVEGNSENT